MERKGEENITKTFPQKHGGESGGEKETQE
jgi:hypothetical protein